MTAPMTTWVESDRCDSAVTGESYLDRLANAGVLAEAEQVWDAEDQGINPCEAVDVDDVIAEARRREQR